MSNKIILGIQVKKDSLAGVNLQQTFSKYGGIIKTRLGLNEVEQGYATREGIILLELTGDITDCQRLENELLTFEGLEVRKMVF